MFVICGGNSLRGVPLGWLRKEDTIAVNHVARVLPEPTYFLTADSGVITAVARENFWGLPESVKKVVVINKDEHPNWDRVKDFIPLFDEHVVPTRWDGNISLDKSQFATGKNTGFCALQYAVHLGYKEIYLLGVDLQFTDGRKYFFEGGNTTKSPYDLFYAHYRTGLKLLLASGVRVFSCSPVSRLNHSIQYVDPLRLVPKMPVFVSHYTKDTPYVDIAKNLVASLEKWHLDYDIEATPIIGTWRHNSNYCAVQVKMMLEKYRPRSILRLDADAQVEAYPDLFVSKGFRCDVAATMWYSSKLRPKGELMGGTLYFANTPGSRDIVTYWIERINQRPNYRNPDLLLEILRKHRAKVNFRELPLSYCRIFDFPNMGPEKVIVHYQASRKCKKIVNEKARYLQQTGGR